MKFKTLSVVASILFLFASTTIADETKPLAGQSFQIQNVEKGDLIRVQDANSADGTPIVLYPKEAWKCMTWKFEGAGDSFCLVNHFTHKTFKAKDENLAECKVSKSADDNGKWKFVPLGNDVYRIEESATGKVFGVDDSGNVVLQKPSDSKSQQWKLLPKPEHFTG